MKKVFLAILLLTVVSPLQVFAQGVIRGGNVHAILLNDDEKAYIEYMRSKGANAVRLFLQNDNALTQTPEQYRDWFYNTALPRLDEAVNLLVNTYGMKALISIHSAPGGRIVVKNLPVDRALMSDASSRWMQDALVEYWQVIAQRYNRLGDSVMYQLFSEPAPPRGVNAWHELQGRLIRAIRTADSTPVSAQPAIYYMTLYGNPDMPKQINLGAKQGKMGILANMYYPFYYTHQLTPSAINTGIYNYPGCGKMGVRSKRKTAADIKRAKSCSHSGLKSSLSKFVRYAKAHKLPMLTPEVAVSRRAPGAARYLSDSFAAFKKLNIGWFYLTFTERGNAAFNLRCADSTSAECIPLPLSQPSSRQLALEKYFAQVKGKR